MKERNRDSKKKYDHTEKERHLRKNDSIKEIINSKTKNKKERKKDKKKDNHATKQ